MLHDYRFTLQKIEKRLALIQTWRTRQTISLPPFHYRPLDGPHVDPPLNSLDQGAWQTIEPGDYWGNWRTDFVMHTTFTVPSDWQGDDPVALYLPLGKSGDFSHPEALIYIDGNPLAAVDRHHQEITLPARYADGQSHRLVLHGWTGLGGTSFWNSEQRSMLMGACAVVQIDRMTHDLIRVAQLAVDTIKQLGDDHPAKSRLLNILDDVFKMLDLREPVGKRFYNSAADAYQWLVAKLPQAGPPLDVDLYAVGHAHIDVAWLWTVMQARRKAGRSFYTVQHLMDEYPHYIFAQSQPQLYEYMRQDYPDLFEKIKQRVAEGRWEPIGGMWVEADCNVSGAEALVRQFVLGRRFFAEHFGAGVESPVLWLPDVFGYPATLPQLIKEAGLEYFFTIKISWNQYNRIPYDTFWWQGLDGTRVLTHFSTTPEHFRRGHQATYNADITAESMLATWRNIQHPDIQQQALVSFGYGDGGGGPTAAMLDNIALLENFPALPRVRHSKVIDFFRNIEQASGDQLPVWNGELYLEYHRGTYTTQARNKQANRTSEVNFHNVEFLASVASLLSADYAYPHDVLDTAWKLHCLNQFHDILPGSSIREVYENALADYAQINALLSDLWQDAATVIREYQTGDLLAVNATSFMQSHVVLWKDTLPEGYYLDDGHGHVIPTQATADGTLLDLLNIQPYSILPLFLREATPPDPPQTELHVAPDVLENRFVRVELNADGDITRIYDKVNRREVLPPKAIANQFQAFEDRPLSWDAWDIDIFYTDKQWLAESATNVHVIEDGPLRASLEIKRTILDSPYTQTLSLDHHSPQLTIHTEIDWRERQTLLKVAFPVDVLSPTATYDIQWGNVERPTHRNTSWDWAMFEVCAHQWADLSEGNFGVSLLNDGKYGHDIHENVMRLTLLRSSTLPDHEADQGLHTFTYALLPHSGCWGTETQAAAYALNNPILLLNSNDQSTAKPPASLTFPLIESDRSNVIIETVKASEDGSGIVYRLYESQRHRGEVWLWLGYPVKAVWRTNFLEEKHSKLTVDDNHAVTLTIKPYEIVTLLVIREE